MFVERVKQAINTAPQVFWPMASMIGSLVRCLGIEVDDAIELAEQIDI
ncbi:hypothetical protein [Hyphomicrobium sulfonivorans]|nr:hypothetical protein [Hyphomicrobium sulfonivorans]MBI1651410.1 hypothetical protein [Hyphomicrobium sulfonivorans]